LNYVGSASVVLTLILLQYTIMAAATAMIPGLL